MFIEAYSVAIITRGTGSYTYTYAGTAGLERGQLCAVSFRGGLETGIVVREDSDPPSPERLIPLVPVEVVDLGSADDAAWGALLCDLAELSASAPRDVAGHLLFAPPARGMRLRLNIHKPAALPTSLRGDIASVAGELTPKRRKALMAFGAWPRLAELALAGVITFDLSIAGLPGQTRPHAKLRNVYIVDQRASNLLGFGGREAALTGSFLAGIQKDLHFPWPVVKRSAGGKEVEEVDHEPPRASSLRWQRLDWPDDWALCRRWPELKRIPLRHVHTTWAKLRAPQGLSAELSTDAGRGGNTLVIAPMEWLLTRIWSQFAPWAPRVHRYRSDAGPSAASAVLAGLSKPGQIVLGLESAWKLAVYGKFQRVILLDPSHPHYEPEGASGLDARLALLLSLARTDTVLDLVDFGLSPWDGTVGLARLSVKPPMDPRTVGDASGRATGFDPVPLELRQPDRKRLVCFNRLGRSRGLRCAECHIALRCPQCGSRSIYYSEESGQYICTDCAWSSPDLRCRNCGTATLAAEFPGVEALSRRARDVLVAGKRGRASVPPDTASVLGTMQLLEPPAGFWPQEVVYVHADLQRGALDDWPRAIDVATRLAALYDNPQLEQVHIVSSRLSAKLGTTITDRQVQAAYSKEMALRRLAELPPWGCLLRADIHGRSAGAVGAAGEEVTHLLQLRSPDAVLWSGKTFGRHDGYHQLVYAVNPYVSHEELQKLRFAMRRRSIGLLLAVLWGPWL